MHLWRARAQVMFYCSRCGCAAQNHEITNDWKKEQAGKAQQERKRHQQHENYYKQKHQERSQGQVYPSISTKHSHEWSP